MGWWGYKPDETDGFYNIKKSFKVLNKKTISEDFEAFLTNTEYERLDRLYFYLGFWDYLKIKKKDIPIKFSKNVKKFANELFKANYHKQFEESAQKEILKRINSYIKGLPMKDITLTDIL